MKQLRLLIVGVLLFGIANAQDRSPLSIPQLLAKLGSTHNDTARLRLLLTLADSYIMKPGEEKTDLDSALLLVSQVQKATPADPHRTGICYLLTSKILREKGRPDSGRKYSLIAAEILGREGQTPDWAFACAEVAHCYELFDVHEDSLRIAWYYKALPVFESTGRKVDFAATLDALGNAIGHLDPAASIPVLQRALAADRALGPNNDLRGIYTLLATEYNRAGDPVNAIYYGLEAVRLEEKRPQMDAASVAAYNHLGLVYYSQGDLKEAISCLRRARDLSYRLDTADIHMLTYSLAKFLMDDHQYIPAISAIRESIKIRPALAPGDSFFQANSFCEYYLHTNRVDSARPYAERLIHLQKERKPDDGILKVSSIALLDYFLASGQYESVRKYGHDMLTWAAHHGDALAAGVAYRQLSKADSSLGDYLAAMNEYQSSIDILDSVRNARDARQIASLKLQYDLEKKDKDILSLTHNQQLSNLALHQAGLTRNFIIAGSVLLLILLGVAINRYRLKQRSNRQLSHLLSEKDVLLTEKEWLLKEIHHRVKNNLQIGISLLNLQSYHIENEKAQSAIRQSRNRMYAMSLIHQRLYQADNLRTIDMQQYVAQLIESIADSYASEKEIDFQLAVQPLGLDVEHALPIGLILNETITNSLKYAFPDRRKGRISIILDTTDHHITLSVADNGVGAPAGFELHRDHSMGMQLIDILVQQLDGSIQMENQHGLAITIQFPRPNAPAFRNPSVNRRYFADDQPAAIP